MAEYIDIHAQTAHLGLAQWDTAATDAAALWKEGTARIRQLARQTPWGGDSSGTAFAAAYTKDGGPEQMISTGDRIMKDVADLAGKVRTAVATTLQTDRKQARAVRSI